MNRAFAALSGALIVFCLWFGAPGAGAYDVGPFNNAVTRGLGAEVTLHTRRALAAEQQTEGPGGINNPYNTTWALPGSTCANSVCVRNYDTPQDGIKATILTLKQNGYGYAPIRKRLRANAPATAIVKGFGESSWGTSLSLVLAVLDDIKHNRTPNTLAIIEHRQITN